MPSQKFADKYLLAVEQAAKEKPQGGLSGFEQEWNLLDDELRPLLTVGAGPNRQSFVDYLRAECIPPWMTKFSQLEVFHWMVEWATRPYYAPRGAIYEARLMEATLLNASIVRALTLVSVCIIGTATFYFSLTSVIIRSPAIGVLPSAVILKNVSISMGARLQQPEFIPICPCLIRFLRGTSCIYQRANAATSTSMNLSRSFI